MINWAYWVVIGFIALTIVSGWIYFRRYLIARPPIGVFDFTDIVLFGIIIVAMPYIYLVLPLWFVGGLLALGTLNILYLTWMPILRSRWVVWALILVIMLVDVAVAAVFTTYSNLYFAVNDAVLSMI